MQAVGAVVRQIKQPRAALSLVLQHQDFADRHQQQFADGLQGELVRPRLVPRGIVAGRWHTVGWRQNHAVDHRAQLLGLVGLQEKIEGGIADGVNHVMAVGRVEHGMEGEGYARTDVSEKIQPTLSWHLISYLLLLQIFLFT